VTPLLAVDDVDTAATLCDAIADDLPESVHAVHVFPPDAPRGSDRRRDGEEALNVVRSRLSARATVRLHRREGDPATVVPDVADEVDADSVLVGAGGRVDTLRDTSRRLRVVD
jgi:nucleotide-binding universal stress UspA family protein